MFHFHVHSWLSPSVINGVRNQPPLIPSAHLGLPYPAPSREGVNEGTWAALGRGCCVWGRGKPIWGVGETRRLLFPSGEVGREGQQARSHLLAQSSQGVACEANFLWEEEKKSHGSCPNPLLRKRVRPDRADLGLYLGVLGVACAGEAPGATGRR